MSAVLDVECPRCGRLQDPEQKLCGLCGNLLRREAASVMSASTARSAANARRDVAPASIPAEPHSDREPWIYLAIGLATAPVFALTPILGFMGWFLASLVHEMGHAAFAWVCGMPAIPAISLA